MDGWMDEGMDGGREGVDSSHVFAKLVVQGDVVWMTHRMTSLLLEATASRGFFAVFKGRNQSNRTPGSMTFESSAARQPD